MNTYIRNGIIYIDIKTQEGRYRTSTKLNESGHNLALIKNHMGGIGPNISKKVVKKILSDIKNGNFKNDETLEFYADRYLKNKSLNLKSMNGLKNSTLNIFSFFDKKTNIKDITPRLIEDFIHSMDRSRTSIYNNMILSNLKGIFDLAIIDGVIEKNPCDIRIKPGGTKIKEKEPYSLEQTIQILKACDDKEIKNYLTVAFFTGARCGEIFALEWEDINFDLNTISINKSLDPSGAIGNLKTKKSKRVIDMLPIVKECLLSFKAKRKGRIFKGSYGQLSSKYKNKFKKILKDLNFQQNSLYVTRHTFASIMLSKGEEPMWVGMHMCRTAFEIKVVCK